MLESGLEWSSIRDWLSVELSGRLDWLDHFNSVRNGLGKTAVEWTFLISRIGTIALLRLGDWRTLYFPFHWVLLIAKNNVVVRATTCAVIYKILVFYNTAKFIDDFDKLFNCFKSHQKERKTHGSCDGFCSEHEAFLKAFLEKLDSLNTPNSSRALPCIVGWKITINSLLALWAYFCKERHYKFLLTARFNQDCLEFFFSYSRIWRSQRQSWRVAV